MIWSSPTYHGSVSGSFKNALDWLILSFDRDGRLADDAVADQLRALGAEVVRAARQFRAEGTCDYADTSQFTQDGSSAPMPT